MVQLKLESMNNQKYLRENTGETIIAEQGGTSERKIKELMHWQKHEEVAQIRMVILKGMSDGK